MRRSTCLATARVLLAGAVAASLAACGDRDVVAPGPTGLTPAVAPHRLLAPGEWSRTVVDSSDAAGNHVMISEFAAGLYTQPDGVSASVGSVTVRTYIPAAGAGASGYCITSTIVGVETTAGWTASIKKPGGCDKEIAVELSNRATGQKAVFSYLYIAGKTRIDAGAVR